MTHVLDLRKSFRSFSPVLVAVGLAMVPGTSDVAQADDRGRAFRDAKRHAEPPAHHHRDDRRHHGHSPYRAWDTQPNPIYPHTVPNRIIHAPPHHSHHAIVHRGSRFHYHDDRWYRAVGTQFVAVAPPIGFVVQVLPPVYRTVWVDRSRYYYADNVYYVPHPQGYVVTPPPPGEIITEQPATSDAGDNTVEEQPAQGNVSQAPGDRLFIYPRQGQSKEQQEKDRSECHRRAVGQTGYDPNIATNTTTPTPGDEYADYLRAVSACLEGRGYTVK